MAQSHIIESNVVRGLYLAQIDARGKEQDTLSYKQLDLYGDSQVGNNLFRVGIKAHKHQLSTPKHIWTALRLTQMIDEIAGHKIIPLILIISFNVL